MRSLLVLIALFIIPQSALAGLPAGVSTCDVRRLAAGAQISEKAEIKQLKKMARIRNDKFVETATGRMSEPLYYELMYASKMPGYCRFDETRYTTADAEMLAAAWGTDVAGAKAIVEQKIAQGLDYMVLWSVDPGMGTGEKLKIEPPIEQYAYDAFWGSEAYTYCDARVLAEMWQTDEITTKSHIGDRVHWNDPAKLAVLDGKLLSARQGALSRGEVCEFWETDRTYDDALALAKIWRTTPEQAKLRASDMVIRGQARALADLLRTQ